MRVHRCPKCAIKGRNHGFNLKVFAIVECVFQQQFQTVYAKTAETFLPIGYEPTWSGESMMTCQDYGHADRAIEFGAEYFPNTEPLITAHTYDHIK